MKILIDIILAILILPFLLIKENFSAERGLGRKILFILVILFVFGFTWIRGYKNLVDATKIILFTTGIMDKLTDVHVQGESMLPTIKNGETLTLHNPKKFKPEKGDIVSFKNLETSGVYYVKRVIATEGEQILLENGTVKINGQVLGEPYVYNNSPTYGNTYILDCKPYTVPKGNVAVMGDNRIASTDSRIIGFIDLKDIDGVIKTGIKPIIGDVPAYAAKELEINTFIGNLNENRKETFLAPLSENGILAQEARERSKFISENISSWKQKGSDLSQNLEDKGYDFLLAQEIVTMGNYDAEELTKHVLELFPYNQDFLSDKYYEIGVSAEMTQFGSCSTPVIVIILGWPTIPNYSQEVIDGMNKEVKSLENLINTLKSLRSDQSINASETDALISDATALLEQTHTFRNIILQGRWPTESESNLTESYQQKMTDFRGKLADYLNSYSGQITDPSIKNFLDQFKWGNPEFNVKSENTRLLFGQGKYDEQLKSARELLTLAKTDPEKAIAHYWQGLAYYNLNDMASAKTNLNQAVRYDPTYAAPHVTLAAVSFSEGNYQQGLTYAQKCVELDPDYGWCHNNLGLAYAYLGQKEAAVRELQKAVELDPNSYVFVNNLTRIKNEL